MDDASTGFRRLSILLNAGFIVETPAQPDAAILRRRTWLMPTAAVILYPNGTVVLPAADGEELRIRSCDPDDALHAWISRLLKR